MPDTGQAGTVVGLVAAGVGLGGMLVFLGFIGARAMTSGGDDDSDSEDLELRRRRERRRRRRRRRKESSDDEESGGQAITRQPTARQRSKTMAEWRQEEILGAGFSMEQARLMAESGKAQASMRTPAQVLADLQRGNVRFWTGQAHRPEKSAFERRALISMQYPSVAVLGCSDSRVPIEIIFDQGLGDMFVIRVAGNCLDTTTKASLLYAVNHLKVKVVLVLGHEGCGAVKAAQLPLEAIDKEPEVLGKLLKGLRRGLDSAELPGIQDAKALDREAVSTNVKAQVEQLVRDSNIMAKVDGGELIMLGALYEISSGIVDFFHEVSATQDEQDGGPIQRAPSRGVLSRRSITPPRRNSRVNSRGG